MFCIGWISVIPKPQFALRMKLSRQRSDSLIWQLSSSSVVLFRSKIAESISHVSRRCPSIKLTRGMTTRQPAAAAASIAWLIRWTSVPSNSLGVNDVGLGSSERLTTEVASRTDESRSVCAWT